MKLNLFFIIFLSFAQAKANQPACKDLTKKDKLPVHAKSFAQDKTYSPCKITIEGTNFFLLTRTNGLGRDRITKAVNLAWPKFYKRFKISLPDSVLIDAEGPIGGGPIAQFLVGLYSAKTITSDAATYIDEVLGWPPQKSTENYIKAHYSNFSDPIQAYVNDIVTHELGHFIFGFGITKTKKFTYSEAWFALGLGLVYDRLIYSEQEVMESPLFAAGVNIWHNKFEKMPGVDQRLVTPDESKDEMLKLRRLQTYAHGKAWIYLKTLRAHVGEQLFDKTVATYLARPLGSSIYYDDFIALFPQELTSKIKEMEKQFKVR